MVLLVRAMRKQPQVMRRLTQTGTKKPLLKSLSKSKPILGDVMMNELIDFLNQWDMGYFEEEEDDYLYENIKENPCGIWGFRDGVL